MDGELQQTSASFYVEGRLFSALWMRHVRAIFRDSERRYVFPVAGRSDWWFGASPLGGPNAGSLAAEQHLGECARTISSRDYASPGRFVFWRGARRSMVTSWARGLSCMLSSTRNCLSVRMPISSSRSTRPQGSARSSSLVSPAVTFIGPYTVCARVPNFLLIF